MYIGTLVPILLHNGIDIRLGTKCWEIFQASAVSDRGPVAVEHQSILA